MELMWWYYTHQFSSVQFSPLTDWVIGGTWGTIQQRSSFNLFFRRPLCAVLKSADMFHFLMFSPSSISSADRGITHPRRWAEGRFWRGCHGVWHAWTMQVSISWQLQEQYSEDQQRSWSCSAPSCWSWVPSRWCRDISSSTWFWKPSSLLFFPPVGQRVLVSQQQRRMEVTKDLWSLNMIAKQAGLYTSQDWKIRIVMWRKTVSQDWKTKVPLWCD